MRVVYYVKSMLTLSRVNRNLLSRTDFNPPKKRRLRFEYQINGDELTRTTAGTVIKPGGIKAQTPRSLVLYERPIAVMTSYQETHVVKAYITFTRRIAL